MIQAVSAAAVFGVLAGVGPGDFIAQVVPFDGEQNERFGRSVAIRDDILLVGSLFDQPGGSVSIYTVQNPRKPGLLAKIQSPGNGFASDIAIDGSIVVIGARFDDAPGFSSGSAYLFDLQNPRQPYLITRLTPSDPTSNKYFGSSVGMDDGVVIVGAYQDADRGAGAGSAYLFDAFAGEQVSKLIASDAARDAYFGYSVAIDGTIAVVGAPGDGSDPFFRGAAYIFDVSDPSAPVQRAKIIASDAQRNDNFGMAVEVIGDIVVIGATGNDEHGTDAGAVYLFDISDQTHPVEVAKLLPTRRQQTTCFGASIAVDGTRLLVGAPCEDRYGLGLSVAELFDISNPSEPLLLAQMFQPWPRPRDGFGGDVALDADLVIVGAAQDIEQGVNTGSVYIFQGAEACPADLDGDGDADAEDFFFFLDAFANGELAICDLSGDGDCDAADFFAFLDLYEMPCD